MSDRRPVRPKTKGALRFFPDAAEPPLSSPVYTMPDDILPPPLASGSMGPGLSPPGPFLFPKQDGSATAADAVEHAVEPGVEIGIVEDIRLRRA
jgi:hypothetical protein